MQTPSPGCRLAPPRCRPLPPDADPFPLDADPHPLDADSSDADPPPLNVDPTPLEADPLGCRPPLPDSDPCRQIPLQADSPMNRQTGVKTLPCPKLHLWAVKIGIFQTILKISEWRIQWNFARSNHFKAFVKLLFSCRNQCLFHPQWNFLF